MKIYLMICSLMISGCGYSSKQNDLTGQVKKVVSQTPLLCSDRTDVDVSLGVMKNGQGSMSSQDLWLSVKNDSDVAVLKQAASSGAIVNITYDVARFVWCWNDHIVSHVEISK